MDQQLPHLVKLLTRTNAKDFHLEVQVQQNTSMAEQRLPFRVRLERRLSRRLQPRDS